ncbi:MAG: AsmA-like C-terminal region-containing protein [Candidatus Brocadia sp.]|nr:AsmA-like C-terminal region-containing protein [Candidatus Brocadia sp.]
MKKLLIIILLIVCFVTGIAATVYILARRATSDEAVKSRFLSALRGFGDANIGHAHMDFLEGITIDNLSFDGISEDVKGKSLKIPKIVLKHNPQSLIKGQLNISNAILIAPELTVEKPRDIWSLLDAIKSNFDKIGMPAYVDVLKQGIEIRDLKIHIKEDPETNSPEIKLSGIDITFLPYAGSFKDVIVKGNIDDEFLGNYSFTMRLYPCIPKLEIDAYANNIELNEDFTRRFPYIGNMLWNNYKPVGKVSASCKASFDNRNNQKKMDYVVNVKLNGLEAMYADWPFLLYDVNGDVVLNTEKVYLKRVVGYIRRGNCTSQAEFNGEFDLYGSKKTFVMMIPNLFVNQELLNNVSAFGEQVWLKVQPSGLVGLTLQYNEGEKQERSYFLTVNCKGLEIKPVDFPLPISYVNGEFKLANNVIVFKNASGLIQCGDQSIFTEMNGVYDMTHDRKIFTFHAPNVSITESFLKNIPHKMIGEKIWTSLNPAGKVDVSAQFQGLGEKKNDYTLEINLKDCDIAVGAHRIPLTGIEGRLVFNKDGFLSKHIDAKCCGGHLEGALSIKTKTDTGLFQYEGELNFSRVALEELAQKVKNTEGLLSGLLYGTVKFQGTGADPKNFYAEGRISVNEGYLSEVPIILSVFDFLNLSLTKKESFHSAKVGFVIKDGIIHIADGRVYSDTIELNGRGDINFNGGVHVDVVAGFNKGLFSQLPIVGKLFDFVVGGVRKQLTMVEIKGTYSNPEIHSVPFKPFTRSIKNMFEVLPTESHEAATDTESKKTGDDAR